VTADPSRCPERPPAWFVVTDQGIRLAGPYDGRAEAERARAVVVESIRRSMMRERFPGAEIAARIRAVRVDRGVLLGPWQHFTPDG
jgi:hypothetical protein